MSAPVFTANMGGTAEVADFRPFLKIFSKGREFFLSDSRARKLKTKIIKFRSVCYL